MTSRALLLPVAVGVVLSAHACGGDAAGPDPEPDDTGTVRVVTATSGTSVDPDGYTVRLGSLSRTIDVNGMVSFEGVEAGSHIAELTGIAENCTVVGGPAVDVVVTAGAVAEAAFDVECGAFVRITCPAFELETTGGLPLDEIPMGRLPADFELPVAASVSVDGTAHSGFAFVRTDEPGSPENPRLVVPLHPATPMEGGVVSVTVSDGTRACAPVELTIDPIPVADGEFAAVVNLLQAILAEQAAGLGTTPDELVSTPMDELPRELWPLALAQTVLDDPANHQSLRAAAEGALGEDVRDWLDRIVARTDVRSALEEARPADPRTRHAPDTPAARVTDTQCLPEIVTDDASLLHQCMAAAAEARRAASGISKKVSEDIKLALSAASNFAGEYKIPLVEAVEATFTFAFWLIYNEREKTAALYPSRFTSMTVEVDRNRFAEDEDARGRVTRAEVSATSEGYDLQQAIFDAFKEGLSFAETTAKFDFSTGNPLDRAFAKLRPVIERRLAEMEIEDLKVPPELFGPVDVTDPQWIQARVAAGEAIRMVDDLDYEPALWGPATLSVRTFDGKFGGEQIAEQVEVTVPAIQIVVTPEERVVEASDPDEPEFVTFRVEVLESHSPDSVDLDLSEHPEQGLAEIRVTAGGSVHEVDYLAPAEPDYDEVDLIVVRHTARAGARANGPPRTGTATVRFASITITGGQPCVEPGESTEPFVAEVRGLDDESVVWTASAGSIDENGVFTAPPEPPAGREVTITATSTSEPEVSEEVTIGIGACNPCRYDLTLSGGFGGTAQGPAGFGFDGSVLELGLDGDLVQDTPGDRIHSGFTAPWDGETGTFSVTYGTVANRTTSSWALYDPGDPVADCASCGGTLTIEEVTEEVIVGRLEVTLSTLSPDPDLPPTTAVATFRAALITPDPFDNDAFRICVGEWR